MSPNNQDFQEVSSAQTSSVSTMTSTSSDLPLHSGLCQETANEAAKAAALLQKLRERVSEEESTSSSGLSFLELKNHLMVDYLSDLTLLMLTKSQGKSIEGSESVERLVTLRTVLEKMRPIERKLKYQIDKAIKMAETDSLEDNDPLSFRPNPANLVSKLGGEGDEESSDDDQDPDHSGKMSAGKYVVPKNVPMYYEDDKTAEQVEEEKATKKKKSMLSKGMIEDLKRQHLDTPEEIHEKEGFVRKKQIDEMKERRRYEEDHFTRLPITKKMKHKSRQMSTIGNIGDEVTAFGSNFSTSKSISKKRKGGGFKKGAAKKKFKRK